MKRCRLALALLLLQLPVAGAPPRPAAHGTLCVVSDPSGCDVMIERGMRGTTPLTAELLPGDYLVTVRGEGHRPEHRRVSIAAGQRLDLRVALLPLTGLLLVHSTPGGAEITIDGADHGRTPALITTLPLGGYRMRLSLPGFRDKEVEVRLDDRVPRHVQVNLASDSATLEIACEPAGADVLVNGVRRAAAPCIIDRIPAGEVSVEIRAPGYQPFTQTMKLAEGESQRLDVRLEEQTATLQVVSLPDKARVYLDNEFKGETPLTLAGLAPGDHRVRVERPGFDPGARTLTLARGDNRTEEFRLSGNTGSLLVTTEPDGVTLLLDGEECGKTATAAGEELRASAPLRLDHIAEGAHTLKAVRQGYHEKTETFDVKRGDMQTMHVKLERRFIPNYEVTTASGTYRGVFDSRTDEALRLEIAPGVVSTYLLKDVRQHRALPDTAAPQVP